MTIFTPKEQIIIRKLREARKAVNDKEKELNAARRRLSKAAGAYDKAFGIAPVTFEEGDHPSGSFPSLKSKERP